MFKRRKYKIKFVKSYQFVDIGVWYELRDSYVLRVLRELETQFDFDLISVRLRDCFHQSKIVIRCSKVDKNKIFMEFIRKLSGQIEQIKYR
mgnify:CR=1 FL=1